MANKYNIVVLALGLAIGLVASLREGLDANPFELARIPDGIVNGSGYLCEDLDDLKKKETPIEVFSYLNKRDLYPEYLKLKNALSNCPKGKFGYFFWEGKAVSRELFLGNHSAYFDAKNVELFLTKQPDTIHSTLKLCFMEHGAQLPKSIVDRRYYNGFKVQAGCYNRYKVMVPGVAAQTYDGKMVESRANTLPVEVLKLLAAKNAMGLHDGFATKINDGERTPYWAALVTYMFRKAFQEFGLGVYFNHVVEKCFCGPKLKCNFEHNWIEYADLDIVNYDTYVPNWQGEDARYPLSEVLNMLQCYGGPEMQFVATELNEELETEFEACGKVRGALESCKCPPLSNLFCNGIQVALEAFDYENILENPNCRHGHIYCASKECEHKLFY